MNISYNESCTLKNATLEQELILCEEAGFDYIELHIDKLRAYLRTHTRDELQSFFRKNRLKPYAMVGMHTYKALFSEEDDLARRDEFLMNFRFGCEILCAIGAQDMVIVPPLFTESEGKEYNEPWATRLEENVRIFSNLSRLALDYRVRLGIKIFNAPRCSVRTVKECNEILNAVGRDNVGYTLDPFNFYIAEQDNSFACLSDLRPDRIFIVHINGAQGHSAMQADRTYPDEGVMCVDNFLRELCAKGYCGPVSLDISCEEEWAKPPEQVISYAAKSMRNVLGRNHLLESKWLDDRQKR